MNTYAISLSKYVNTGILVVFTLLAYLTFAVQGKILRRVIAVSQCLLLCGFLINANMTIAWITRGPGGRRIILLCAMEVLFLLSFMVLYSIVHEMANMFLFNNICMLLSVGFVVISRISYYGSADMISNLANEPIKQFIMASGGLLVMLVIPFFRRFFDSLRHFGLVLGVVGIVALSGVLLLSAATNGAMITYTIAGFTFQPSEFVKILFILMLAGMLSDGVTKEKLIFVTVMSILHVGILVLSRDLGSALIFFAVFLMMMFMATGRWSVIAAGVSLCAVGSVLCYFLFNHVRVRVLIWRDPFVDYDDLGYQVAQSLFAISYGGLWGAGLTQGIPHVIPNVEKDLIFSAITEEMGLIFGICLLLICINSFVQILFLSAGYSNRFFQLVTYGIAVCYIFQTFLTVGGQTKFIPLTGVTLPLVSYGGSSILSTLTMLGIIEMIHILHEERSARFLAMYEMEHPGDGTAYEDFGSVKSPPAYDALPPKEPDHMYEELSGEGPRGAGGAFPSSRDRTEVYLPHGISEEGIFDNDIGNGHPWSY